MNNPRYIMFFAVVGGVLALGVPICGCKESSETKIKKQSIEKTDEAQRLIRASQEKLAISPGDIREIADQVSRTGRGLSESEQKRFAEQALGRMASQAEIGDIEKKLAEIGQLGEGFPSDGDIQAVKGLCEQLLLASENLLNEQKRIESLTEQVNYQRLEKAETQLRQAITQAHNDRTAQIAPELMLGTLQLVRARQAKAKLHRQELSTQTILMALGQWTVVATKELAVTSQLETFRPDETIAVLEKERTDLQEDIEMLKKSIEHLAVQQGEAKTELETYSQQASQIYQQHLKLLEQADKERGEKRYQLQQQAYQLQLGSDEEPGSIYYEAQTELAQIQLTMLNDRFDFQKAHYERLAKSLIVLNSAIEQLKTSPLMTTDIDTGLENSAKEKARLNSVLMGYLESIKNEESRYNDLRVEAASAYGKAKEAYSNAAGATKGSYGYVETGKFATNLIEHVVNRELADLWLFDTSHYESTAQMLSLIEDIAEAQTGNMIASMIEEFSNKAKAAQTGADELLEKLKQLEAEALELKATERADEPVKYEEATEEAAAGTEAEVEAAGAVMDLGADTGRLEDPNNTL
jgi:hypothetical protein